MANTSDYLKRQGVSERDIKRFKTLANNVMMAGCRFIQHNMNRILKLSAEEQLQDNLCKTVIIDFQQAPPGIKSAVRKGTGEHSSSLKCIIVSPILYGFAAKFGGNRILLEKLFVPDQIEL